LGKLRKILERPLEDDDAIVFVKPSFRAERFEADVVVPLLDPVYRRSEADALWSEYESLVFVRFLFFGHSR